MAAKPRKLPVTKENIIKYRSTPEVLDPQELKENGYTVVSPAYELTLTLGNETYTGKGPTPLEALNAMPKPNKILLKGVLEISYGSLKKTVLMMPVQANRLFHPLKQPFIVKNLMAGFV